MKSYILISIFTIFSLYGSAQNWQGISNSDTMYFTRDVADMQEFLSDLPHISQFLWTDSFYYAGDTLVQIFPFTFRPEYPDAPDTLASFLGFSNMHVTSSGLDIYVNWGNDTIVVNTRLPVGDSSLMMTDTAGISYILKCDSVGETVFMGSTDSARYLSIHSKYQQTDTPSYFDKEQIIITKSHGYLRLPLLFQFPMHYAWYPKEYPRCMLRRQDKDSLLVHTITTNFNNKYAPGNEFYYITSENSICYPNPVRNNTYHRDSIINVIQGPNENRLIMLKEYFTEDNCSFPNIGQEIYSKYIDTIKIEDVYLCGLIDSLFWNNGIMMLYHNTITCDTIQPNNYYSEMVDFDWGNPTKNVYNTSEYRSDSGSYLYFSLFVSSYFESFYDEKYLLKDGLGIIRASKYIWEVLVPYGYDPSFELLYATNDGYGNEYGQKIEIPDAVNKVSLNEMAVEIYPNPSSDKIKIELDASVQGPKNIELLNLQGQTILKKSTNGNNTEIEIADMQPGMYLIKIRVIDTGMEIVRKLIKL